MSEATNRSFFVAFLSKLRLSAINTAVGIVVKLGLDFLLVSKAEYSILGAVIAANVCYALVFMLNLTANLVLTRKKKRD